MSSKVETAKEFDLAKFTRDMEAGMTLASEERLLGFFEAFTPDLVKYCRSLELRLGINPPLPPAGTELAQPGIKPVQNWPKET